MHTSGEGERLQRRFLSAVRASFAVGLPDLALQATFTSLRAEHWAHLGDVIPEDAYALHLNRRAATSISMYGRHGGRERHVIPFHGATLYDLSDLPMVEVEGRYDMMRVYLPRRRMISVAESMAHRSEVRLRAPKPGFDDYIITNVLNIISFAFDNQERATTSHRHVSEAVRPGVRGSRGEPVNAPHGELVEPSPVLALCPPPRSGFVRRAESLCPGVRGFARRACQRPTHGELVEPRRSWPYV
jgi:hypothetical protein